MSKKITSKKILTNRAHCSARPEGCQAGHRPDDRRLVIVDGKGRTHGAALSLDGAESERKRWLLLCNLNIGARYAADFHCRAKPRCGASRPGASINIKSPPVNLVPLSIRNVAFLPEIPAYSRNDRSCCNTLCGIAGFII